MGTKLSSASLRNMIDSDLRFLEINSPGQSFSGIKYELKSIFKSIQRIKEGRETKTDKNNIREFGNTFAGYDDFLLSYKKKNYRRCLEILKKDISELTKRTNGARLKWVITSGVKTELKRRGLLR